MVIKNTTLGGTDWTQERIKAEDLNDTFNAMASKVNTLSAFWLNSELYDVYDDFESFGQNPYVEIVATSVSSLGDFSINNCTLTLESAGVWKLVSSSISTEVQRAEIYKTLFYGTNGTNPRASSTYITSITALNTSINSDIGKQAHYAKADWSNTATDWNSSNTYTGTFANTTTNTDCSTWSDITDTDGNSNGYVRWQVPVGVTLNGSSNEIGTDTSLDTLDNPATCSILISNFQQISTRVCNSIVLCVGDIVWVDSGFASQQGSVTNTDFFTDNGIPLFTTVSGSPSFPGDGSKWTASGTATINASQNAGGTGNELKITSNRTTAGTTTSEVATMALGIDKHTHMRMLGSVSTSWNGTGSVTIQVKVAGSSYKTVTSLGANGASKGASCATDLKLISKGSDVYDFYVGGKIVDADVTAVDPQIYIKCETATPSGSGAFATSTVYIDDVRQSKSTIS
jgi:hypothetical protein